MKKRLGVLFLSVLIVITLLISAMPALANGDEIYYDDGVRDAAVTGYPGFQQRVTFTPLYVPAKITTVKIFIDGGSADLIVHVLDDSFVPLFEGNYDNWIYGWNSIDLSTQGIIVNDVFYVSLEWTATNNPFIGGDANGETSRSVSIQPNGTILGPLSYAHMIRAVIEPANQPPVAEDDVFSTDEDTQLNVDVPGILGNDSDPDGDSMSAVLDAVPAHASDFILDTDGSFSYTPDPDFYGSDSFTYKANDGTADSNVATVTINITPVNDAPDAVDDDYTTSGGTISVPASGVLANDTDVEGDTLYVFDCDETSSAGGSVSMSSDGSFTYTPPLYFVGTDTFTYTISDGNGGTDTATVSVTIIPITVNIDIKPGSDPNSLNLNDKGVIPVAILGSAVLDVSDIDPGSILFEGMAVKAVGKNNKLLAHIEDVNGDGIDDLVVQIQNGENSLSPGDTEATIAGYLGDGTLFVGLDWINIVA